LLYAKGQDYTDPGTHLYSPYYQSQHLSQESVLNDSSQCGPVTHLTRTQSAVPNAEEVKILS